MTKDLTTKALRRTTSNGTQHLVAKNRKLVREFLKLLTGNTDSNAADISLNVRAGNDIRRNCQNSPKVRKGVRNSGVRDEIGQLVNTDADISLIKVSETHCVIVSRKGVD